MTKLVRMLALVAVAGLVAAGCSTDYSPVQSSSADEPIAPKSRAMPSALAAGDMTSATLNLYVSQASNHQITVHRITDDWTEMGVTWANFGGYDATSQGFFVADGTGWRSVNITALVQAWFEETHDNFGVLLDQGELNFPRTTINSREAAENQPYLEICFEGMDCVQVSAVADAYIYESAPDDNTGDRTYLNTGWGWETDLEKQALVRFELPDMPELAALGDFVWYDENEDGIQDVGEAGIEGVEVHLFDCADDFIAAAATDADGLYMFTDLIPGDYYVEFFPPAGFVFSPQDQGTDDAVDSDADPITGQTICTNLEAGEIDRTWDAGLYMPPPPEGCTLTIGYWKNHAGFGPQPDYLSQFLTIWLGEEGIGESFPVTDAQIAYDILTMHVYGHPSNGITKLYAQMLAAKLNIANGADGSEIEAELADADAFLAEHYYTDWTDGLLSRRDKKKVRGWKSTFDDYNNGFIGPGHCDIIGDGDLDD